MSEQKTINWDTELTTFNGDHLMENEKPDSKRATLRFVACQAVNARLQEDEGLAKGIKRDRAYLIKKLRRKDVAELSNENMELIKGRIEKIHPPWTVGECFDLLDGINGESPKEKAE